MNGVRGIQERLVWGRRNQRQDTFLSEEDELPGLPGRANIMCEVMQGDCGPICRKGGVLCGHSTDYLFDGEDRLEIQRTLPHTYIMAIWNKVLATTCRHWKP
jgi:hypothetical protein